MTHYVSASILSDDPLIIFSGGSWSSPVSSSALLAGPLHHRRVIFILLTLWSAEGAYHADKLTSFIRQHEEEHPLHSYIVFCNTAAEVKNLGRRGIRAYFGQQNSFVDPDLYKISADTKKDFLTVYTAQLSAFKRHALCSELQSVALIYYNYGPDTKEYYDSIRKSVPGARFMNDELAPPHGGLPPEKVAEILTRSRVGLCLSAEEGGMHASIEYLLAGLPVVSTPSRGGRDFFFHQDFVEIAAPTSEGVKVAVDNILRRAPGADEIRSRTIALQQKQIALFRIFLDRLVRAEGAAGYSEAQWNARYCDKLLGWDRVEDFLGRIPSVVTTRRRRSFRKIERALVRLRNLYA